MHGFSTSTTDQNGSVRHSRSQPTRKWRPRITDGVEHPIEVRKVEPIVPRERTLSAIQAETVERLGYLPTLGNQ